MRQVAFVLMVYGLAVFAAVASFVYLEKVREIADLERSKDYWKSAAEDAEYHLKGLKRTVGFLEQQEKSGALKVHRRGQARTSPPERPFRLTDLWLAWEPALPELDRSSGLFFTYFRNGDSPLSGWRAGVWAQHESLVFGYWKRGAPPIGMPCDRAVAFPKGGGIRYQTVSNGWLRRGWLVHPKGDTE